MESSGVYWKPVLAIPEGQVHLTLANAAHIKRRTPSRSRAPQVHLGLRVWRHHLRDPAVHSGVMRAFPVDAAALPASLVQQTVASHAARERLDRSRQVEAVDDFGELTAAFRFSQPVAVRNTAALQQPAVAREQDAMRSRGD